MNKFQRFITAALPITFFAFALNGCSGDDIEREVPNEITPAIVTISVDSFTWDFANVTFTPNAQTARFSYAIGTVEDLGAFAKGTLAGIITVEGNSVERHTFTGLEENTAYTVFAAGFDSDGKMQGIQTAVFNTIDRSRDELFELGMQFTAATVAGVAIELSQSYASYEYKLYKGLDETGTLAVSGSESETFRYFHTFFDLEAEQDYYFTVTATTRSGIETTKELLFRTKKESEVPGVELEITQLDIMLGTYKISAANSLTGGMIAHISFPDQFLGIIVNKDIGAGNYFDTIRGWAENFINNTHAGSTNFTFQYATDYIMQHDFELRIIALSYYQNGDPANIQIFDFATPPIDDTAGTASMSVSIINVTSSSAEYQFAPNAETLGFYIETFDGEAFENEFLPQQATNPNYIQEFLRDYYSYTLMYARMPLENWAYEFLEPGTKYYCVAAPFNVNGPQNIGWGDLFYQSFTTLESE